MAHQPENINSLKYSLCRVIIYVRQNDFRREPNWVLMK